MALVQRTSTGPINPALQSINLGNDISNESQDEVQTINQLEQQSEPTIPIINQPSTSSILIAPRKRGRPKKN